MAELAPLAANAVFPEGEITGPGIRVWALESPPIAAMSARRESFGELDAKVQAAFGLALPAGPRLAEARGVAFLGTGPDTWLAVAVDSSLVERLAQTCDGLAAIADQSGAYGVLALQGPGVRDLLARAVAIDLDPRVFPEGSAAVCAFGHLGAILWRTPGPDSFRLALSRSTAADAWRFVAHVADALTACA